MTTSGIAKVSPAAFAARHPTVVKVGRFGWLVKGAVYLLSGILTVTVLVRSIKKEVGTSTPTEASPTGAIKQIAELTFGRILLIALGIGLLVYSLWRLATATMRGHTDVKATATRVGYFVSAIIYATLSLTAFSLATDPRAPADGNKKVRSITTRILDYPAGRWAIGFAGIAAIGAGIYRLVMAYQGDVTGELSLGSMSAQRAKLTKYLARWGEAGRGIAVCLIGFFLVRAALTVNPDEATGLDGALGRVARVAAGQVLVAVVAAGFILYGVMCIETFRYRKLQTP